MSSRFSSPFMAKSPLNRKNLNRSEKRLVDLSEKRKKASDNVFDTAKEKGTSSKEFKKAEKKDERLSKKVNRKFKRKEAKGKVDKDKMVKEIQSRRSKEK